MAPISKESIQPSRGATDYSVIDPNTHQARTKLPSEIAPAPLTRSDSVPQQASTSPGDGAEVHSAQAAPNVDEVGQPHTSPKVPFKEQVLGAAKKTRGTLLGNAELKEDGEMILEGQKSGLEELKSHHHGSP